MLFRYDCKTTNHLTVSTHLYNNGIKGTTLQATHKFDNQAFGASRPGRGPQGPDGLPEALWKPFGASRLGLGPQDPNWLPCIHVCMHARCYMRYSLKLTETFQRFLETP